MQPEHLDAGAEVGERAVGNARGAVGAERRVDAGEVAGELVRFVPVVGEPVPDPHERVR